MTHAPETLSARLRSHVGKQDVPILLARRAALRAECGLDAFAQPAEVWLEMAVAAAARGEDQYARDCERAMDLSNERYAPPTRKQQAK